MITLRLEGLCSLACVALSMIKSAVIYVPIIESACLTAQTQPAS